MTPVSLIVPASHVKQARRAVKNIDSRAFRTPYTSNGRKVTHYIADSNVLSNIQMNAIVKQDVPCFFYFGKYMDDAAKEHGLRIHTPSVWSELAAPSP